jgi:hypothetical protein
VAGVLDDLPYETYTGEDPACWLLENLIEYETRCTDFPFSIEKMRMTAVDHVLFAGATHCYICGGDFNDGKKGLKKVRYHNHISGPYCGAAHCKCNLLKRLQRKVPVFFHNLRGYDEHILIPALGK